MPSIHYDPKFDSEVKKRAAKKALKKIKDAFISTTKRDLKKAKQDIKEAGRELAKGFLIYY